MKHKKSFGSQTSSFIPLKKQLILVERKTKTNRENEKPKGTDFVLIYLDR